MIKFVRENSKSIKISIEIEKTRTVLGELLPLGDVVFISKEFSQFSGFPTMKEAVKGFIGLSRPGYVFLFFFTKKSNFYLSLKSTNC
jgi:hypothetical protein